MREKWRLAFLIVLVGLASAGCAFVGTSTADERVEVFADLPQTCQEIDVTVAGSLRLFGAGLPSPEDGLTGESRSDGTISQSLRCAQTFENPIPAAGTEMPDRGPMLRSVYVNVSRSAHPPLPWRTSDPMTPGFTVSDIVAPATKLPGVGQGSITWMERDRKGVVSAHAKTVIDNLTITIQTSGADWSNSSPPTRDSPDLRADLRAGVEAMATAMAVALPSRLPRTTISAYEWLPTASREPSLPSPPKIAAWDPCTLAGSVATAAGLPGDAKPSGEYEFRGCAWATDWGYVEIHSGAVTFDDSVYQIERYLNPKPIVFGARTAVQVTESERAYTCVLAFDTPFGTRDGRSVGSVRIDLTVVYKSRTSRPACDLLTPIGASLAPHIPPER